MIQLEIEGVFVDLYDSDPIKLNFNIEDLTDVSIKSEYSRQFRVPATAHNSQLFQTLFEVEGYDFDVTQKREASILIDGAEFRRGEVRLLNIYRNDRDNKVDYEVVFLGSAKSLGSKMGNASLNDLDFTSYIHDIDYTNVTNSWQAFPEGGLTDGLFNGDVIYPLVDFGNTYDGNGTVEQTRIAVGSGLHFTNSASAIGPSRLRPMMRAKAILDNIFSNAGFTYDSSFLNSNEFKQIYLSLWGNETEVNINAANANLARWYNDSEATRYEVPPSDSLIPPATGIVYDYGDNLVEISFTTQPLTLGYLPPQNGIYAAEASLGMSFYFLPNGQTQFLMQGLQFPASAFDPAAYRVTFVPILNELEIEIFDGASYVPYETITGQAVLQQISGQERYVIDYQFNFEASGLVIGPVSGDEIKFGAIAVNGASNPLNVGFFNTIVTVTQAAGGFIPSFLFDADYKQIDFVKDLFKMFRLVMVPDVNDPTNFKIEPWAFYVGSGQVKDWSNKLDLNKDKVLRPTVLDQKDRLFFQMAEDKDWLNSLNLDEFKEPFGTQIVNSGYEILDDEQVYETKCAPTPFTQIQGYFANTAAWEDVIIPQICTQEATDAGVQFKPIKAKPRFLYYNGLTSSGTWYLLDNTTPTAQTEVPIVSYYSQWPPNPNAKILNFQKENGYDQEGVFNTNYGSDLYSRYWSSYISTIYDKWGRRLTAYFSLDQADIMNFDYDDVIFIEGSYYYVEKIYDAPLEGKNTVKVDLIKLLNYNVNTGPFIPPTDLNIWNLFDEVWNITADTWND